MGAIAYLENAFMSRFFEESINCTALHYGDSVATKLSSIRFVGQGNYTLDNFRSGQDLSFIKV